MKSIDVISTMAFLKELRKCKKKKKTITTEITEKLSTYSHNFNQIAK